MEIPSFYLEPANFQLDFEVLRQIRTMVFVIEQKIPVELEFDEEDMNCRHFIARTADGAPIGTGRLSPEGKIGRLAVLAEWRGQGVGTSILRILIENAHSLGLRKVTAEAQLRALGIYQKFGFKPLGEAFIAVGIPHQTVELNLQAVHQERISRKPREESVPAQQFSTVSAAVDATLQIIKQTHRQLYIYSQDLEYALYGQNEIIEALKQLVLNNRKAEVQIIIQEPNKLRSQTHPLIGLAQRVSSHFQLRTPIETEDLQTDSAFTVNDDDSYLFRLQGNRFHGHWSPNQPALNCQLQEEFQRIWQRSRPCTEFRALNL
jgi:predicted GNAT family N-acyltransferase